MLLAIFLIQKLRRQILPGTVEFLPWVWVVKSRVFSSLSLANRMRAISVSEGRKPRIPSGIEGWAGFLPSAFLFLLFSHKLSSGRLSPIVRPLGLPSSQGDPS